MKSWTFALFVFCVCVCVCIFLSVFSKVFSFPVCALLAHFSPIPLLSLSQRGEIGLFSLLVVPWSLFLWFLSLFVYRALLFIYSPDNLVYKWIWGGFFGGG